MNAPDELQPLLQYDVETFNQLVVVEQFLAQKHVWSRAHADATHKHKLDSIQELIYITTGINNRRWNSSGDSPFLHDPKFRLTFGNILSFENFENLYTDPTSLKTTSDVLVRIDADEQLSPQPQPDAAYKVLTESIACKLNGHNKIVKSGLVIYDSRRLRTPISRSMSIEINPRLNFLKVVILASVNQNSYTNIYSASTNSTAPKFSLVKVRAEIIFLLTTDPPARPSPDGIQFQPYAILTPHY
jgi:hypothetical protein